MKKRTALLTLLTVPFLMGNSPMPYPQRTDYTDFDYQLSVISENETTNRYQVEIKNKGSFHVYNSGSINYPYFEYFYLYTQDNTMLCSFNTDGNGQLFTTQTLGPGQTATYVFEYKPNKIDINNVSYIRSSCFNQIDEEVTYNYPGVRKLNTGSHHTYKIDTKVKNLHDYYYAVAVDAKYDGKDYSFVVTKDNLEFVSYQDLDLDKFSIEKLTFYRSTYNTYKGNTSMYWLFGFITAGIIVLFVAPIVFITIFSIRAGIRRHKRKQK